MCFIYFVKHCPQEALSSSSVDNTEESTPVSVIDILLEFFSRLISVLLYKPSPEDAVEAASSSYTAEVDHVCSIS